MCARKYEEITTTSKNGKYGNNDVTMMDKQMTIWMKMIKNSRKLIEVVVVVSFDM